MNINPTYLPLLKFDLNMQNITPWLELLSVTRQSLGAGGLFETTIPIKADLHNTAIRNLGFLECKDAGRHYWNSSERNQMLYDENIILKLIRNQFLLSEEKNLELFSFIFEDPSFFENINIKLNDKENKKTTPASVNPLFLSDNSRNDRKDFILLFLNNVKKHLKSKFSNWLLENKIIFYAVAREIPEVLNFVIKECPESVNSINYIGETPAMLVLRPNILEILAQAGANLNAANKQGKTVLSYIQEVVQDGIRQELTKTWKKYNKKEIQDNADDIKNQILTSIKNDRSKKEIEGLIKCYKKNLAEIHDENNANLLNLACKTQKKKSGHLMPIVKQLFNEYKLDLFEPDNQKITAAHHLIFLSLRRIYDIDGQQKIISGISEKQLVDLKENDKYASFLSYHLKFNTSGYRYYNYSNNSIISKNFNKTYKVDFKSLKELFEFQKDKIVKEFNFILPDFFTSLKNGHFEDEIDFMYQKTKSEIKLWEGFVKNIFNFKNEKGSPENISLIFKLVDSQLMAENKNFILYLPESTITAINNKTYYGSQKDELQKFNAKIEELKVAQALQKNPANLATKHQKI